VNLVGILDCWVEDESPDVFSRTVRQRITVGAVLPRLDQRERVLLLQE